MKVSDLQELLADCDPEAEVFIHHQQNWPLESTLQGVTVRSEITDADADHKDEHASNDVILVEGRQVGYGSKASWNVT